MADSLTIGSYAFVGGNFHVTNFAHGIASPADYAVAEWESNPSPRAWPFVTMHDNADRAVVGYVSCTTESLARQELALIAASCTVGSSLTWQPDGQATAVSCTVLAVDIDVPAFDPVTRRIAVASGHIDVTVSIRTTPYWLGPEVETTLSVSSGVPFTAPISGVGGDVPALTRVRYTHAQATSMLALAMRSNPGAGFSPIQDYSGVADGDAFGGECTTAYHGTNTHTTLGTPSSIDVGDNRGDYLVMARVKQEASDTSTVNYRAVSTVQGGVGGPAYAIGADVHPVTTASAGWDVLDLGVMPLPAGRVQAGLSGMSYGPETIDVQQDTSNATDTNYGVEQTFKPTVSGRISAISVYAKDPSGDNLTLLLMRGTVIIGMGITAPLSSSWSLVRVGVNPMPPVVAGETLLIVAYDVDCAYNTANVYADGARTSGGDLRFRVHVQPLITVGATIGVQETCSVGSKDSFLDVVGLLPTDEACVKVTTAAGAGEGVVIDYLSDNEADHDIYICDAVNTGISVISGIEPYGGPFLLRPGDTTLVGVAATPGTDPPGDATLVITTRNRSLLPYTGE